MTPMTLEEFYAAVNKAQHEHPTWRYGQVVFNTLYDHRPDLSEQVRATALDPFYKDGGDWVWEFNAFLAENWGDQ